MHASEARATNKLLFCSHDEFILIMASKVGPRVGHVKRNVGARTNSLSVS